MICRVRFVVFLSALIAFVGCSPDSSNTSGATYDEIEAGWSASEAAERNIFTAPESEPQSDTATEAIVDPGDDPAILQAAATVPLTPEQEMQVAAIQVQPGYEDGEKLFFVVDGAMRVQFDDLDLVKALNMTYIPSNATKYFPDWMMALDGKRVRLRGFMYNTYDGVSRFLLCRDLGLCCFGPNPRADYRIPVHLQEGETTNWIFQIPFDVVGTFHIHLTIDDLGNVSHTYAISEATIIRL